MSIPRAKDSSPTDLRKRYHVIAKLGEGGMAVVHLAVVRGVGGVRKLVVLKSIRPELVADPRMGEMFLSEARIAATLGHPNIVQTFEVAVFGGRPVLVMEFLDGQSLSRVLHRDRRETVPLSAQLYALKDVLSGLEYVHNLTDLDGTPLNLVHRDISPPNIFVTYDGHIKILDFGIAKNLASTGNTEAGIVKGKIRYMAPEQLLGAESVDRRADIFSVGVMLWEAVTGKRLWEGVPEAQIVRNLVTGAMPAPCSIAPSVAPALEAICKKALSHRSEDRYETAAAMQGELEAAIHDLGLETTHRQVGKLVSELFAERRTSTRTVLEQQLRDEAAAPVSLVLSDDSDVDSWASMARAGIEADPWGLPTAVSVGPPPRRMAGLRRKTLLLASIVAWPITVEVPASAASKAQEAPRSVSVLIHASPPRARLFLDDVLLAGNPFKGEVPSDSGRHAVRAEARGYRSRTVAVTLSQPLDLDVDLVPLAPAITSGVLTAAESAAVTAPSASDVSDFAARSCNPPFYFDESRIKRIKIECLK